jgi:integrase
MEVVQAGGKGRVAIYDRDGLYWLRWSYRGKRYSLAVGHAQIKPARALAARIEADMAAGHFDSTLEAYRPQVDQKVDQKFDSLRGEAIPVLGVVELWQRFTDYRRRDGTSGATIAAKYLPMKANLTRWGGEMDSEDAARQLVEYLRSRQSVTVANQNLALLKGFGRWCVEQGHWQSNHFEKLKPAKVQVAAKRDNPFTADEVKRFLTTIKTDPHYFVYHDFAYCLFHLGCRPSELIGLRWGAIDFNRRMITISESLSRGDDGKTAGYARKRKATKTGNVRVLPMTESVFTLLTRRFQECQPQSPDELVFTSPTGRAIDDHNFSQRCWRRICQKAGIPYRPPYIARHTALSHIVESTGSLAMAAAVAGHSSLRMVSQTYGHLIAKIQMPAYE